MNSIGNATPPVNATGLPSNMLKNEKVYDPLIAVGFANLWRKSFAKATLLVEDIVWIPPEQIVLTII